MPNWRRNQDVVIWRCSNCGGDGSMPIVSWTRLHSLRGTTVGVVVDKQSTLDRTWLYI